MKLTMLGTGNAGAVKCYNTCFVLQENNQSFLVDGGGGHLIIDNLATSNLPIEDIKDIFITHKHMDHIMGIFWVVHIISQKIIQGQYKGDLNIYGHSGVIKAVTNIYKELFDERETILFGDRIHFITVVHGERCSILGKTVTFFDIKSTGLKQFGFSMEFSKDEKLTYCGDEPYRECEKEYAENSKWLLHEAFCLNSEADIFKPYDKNHSTVKDACEAAKNLRVKNLLILHTEDNNIKNRKKLYTEEGSLYYDGNLYVPDDLEVFTL